jgi:tRNA(Ile2) C34 agmatinyltransferase TiaS
MQEVSTTSERSRQGQYVTMKITKESRMVLSEIRSSDPLWRHIDIKDIIALAWPRCPSCGGPLVAKLMSQNLICVRCKAEYSPTRVT